ncbi:MAG TPA: PIN domain-containing protein [Verrucomicrobiales bacterium]|nr:PIN domain-containing protein [Verrucomicrobiales bacterium]
MSGFLLDTNVLSEFSRRGDPDPGVKTWLTSAKPETLYVSVLTLAEMRRGIELSPVGKRREELEHWLDADLIASFLEANILPVTKASVKRWKEDIEEAGEGRRPRINANGHEWEESLVPSPWSPVAERLKAKDE